MKKSHNFKFGVKDYGKTLDNHSSKLRKYKDYLKEDDSIFFEWQTDEENEAWQIWDLQKYPFPGKYSPYIGLRSMRTAVNNWYISEINWYLEKNDLNKYWFTAVYLHHYSKLNKHMDKVANELLNIVLTENANK